MSIPTNHKGSELNNVRETWERNERENPRGAGEEPAVDKEIQKIARDEAEAYDREHSADTLLPGERATVKDEDGPGKPPSE